MSTIEPAQEAYEEFHKGFTLGDQGVSPKWEELLEGHKDRWRAVVRLSREPLHHEIHALKMAAIGGDNAFNEAHAVTVDDVVRYRVEAAEEIERLRVKLNACESSLRGAVRSSDEMRAQLSARWSLIKRMRQDVEGLGLAVPPGAAQEWRNAYLPAWNGHNHLEATGAGIRAVLRTVGASLIERWPAADQDGEPTASARTSPGDPVRAAFGREALAAVICDGFWNGNLQFADATEANKLSCLMAADAVRAALSVSTPTAAITVDVQTMKTSKGADYYVSVACGDRSCTPHMFLDRYKAEYEVAHWQWIFGQREEEPFILDYSEETYPNLYPKIEIPPVSTPTGEGEAMRWAINEMADAAFAVSSTAPSEAQMSRLHSAAEKLLDLRDAALAHPQQGGERDGWPTPRPMSDLPPQTTVIAYSPNAPDGWEVVYRMKTGEMYGSDYGDQIAWLPMPPDPTAPTSPSKSEDEPDLSYSGAPMPPDDVEGCVYCGQPFKEGDLVLNEYEGGLGHIGCFGPERESYVGRDGEPLRDDEPIPTGRPWVPTSPSKSSGEEA